MQTQLELFEMHKMCAELHTLALHKNVGVITHEDHVIKVQEIKDKIDLISTKDGHELDQYYREVVDGHHNAIKRPQ